MNEQRIVLRRIAIAWAFVRRLLKSEENWTVIKIMGVIIINHYVVFVSGSISAIISYQKFGANISVLENACYCDEKSYSFYSEISFSGAELNLFLHRLNLAYSKQTDLQQQLKLNRNVFIEMCQSSRSDRLKFQMHLNCTCHYWLTGEQLQHMSTDMPLILCIEFERLSLQWNTSLKCYLVNCFGVFWRIANMNNVVEWYHLHLNSIDCIVGLNSITVCLKPNLLSDGESAISIFLVSSK